MTHSGHETEAVVRRMLALGIWTALGAVAVVLIGRAASGELHVAIGPWTACALTTLAVALSLYAWWQDHLGRSDDEQFACALRGMTALAAPGVIGLILVQDSAAALTYLLGLAVVAAVGVSDGALMSRGRSGASVSQHPVAAGSARASGGESILPAEDVSAAPGALSVADPESAEESPGTFDDPATSQALSRRQTAMGECVEVLLRIRFVPGEREVALHIPLWPSLSADPDVECEPLDNGDIELRVTSARTYGVRIEARRPADRIQTAEQAAIGVMITAPLAAAATDSPAVIRSPLSA